MTVWVTEFSSSGSLYANRDSLLVDNPGTTYDYGNDLAGKRTEVRVNGAVSESRSYDAADQVVGWQYNAGQV